jgi:hypothetical protein
MLPYGENRVKRWILWLTLILLPQVHGSDLQWEKLKALRPGEVIWINFAKGGKTVPSQARMSAWTEDSLAVRMRKSDVVLARSDVRKVAVHAGKSRKRGALHGFVWGTVTIAPLFGYIGAVVGETAGATAAITVGGSLLWGGGIGAVIGAAVGVTRKETVYEVPKK